MRFIPQGHKFRMRPTVRTQRSFIILGNARTGSNLLVDLLGTYPEVRVLGELLNLNSLKKAEQIRVLNDPVKYLESCLHSDNDKAAGMVGFKIFYYHATREYLVPGNFPDKNIVHAPASLKNRIQRLHDLVRDNYDLDELGPRIEKVWEYLKNDPDLKVIHLKRKNRLATFLSLRRAFMTDQWVRPKGIKAKVWKSVKDLPGKISQVGDSKAILQAQGAIYLSYEDCLEAFQKSSEWENKYDDFFKGHAKVDTFYENLQADPEREMEKIQSLLSLSGQVRLKTSLEKQSRIPLSESIANYQDLKQRFADSPWEEFFLE